LPHASLLYAPDASRVLHSFPTRRSSDLAAADAARTRAGAAATAEFGADVAARAAEFDAVLAAAPRPENFALQGVDPLGVTAEQRSEEHTSELQSRENLVCRLLLEKKKKN